MWFNKNSVFPAFWSGRTTPLREGNRGGLIRMTSLLTQSVLLSCSEKPEGIQFHSHHPQTPCLILVVVKRSVPRWLLHSAGPLWNDPWEEEGGNFWTTIVVFFLGVNCGEWWLPRWPCGISELRRSCPRGCVSMALPISYLLSVLFSSVWSLICCDLMWSHLT